MKEQVIGENIRRLDAPEKAKGHAKYAADYQVRGMLYVALVRAKEPSARLNGIRIPELPEGCYCYTAKDLFSNVIPSVMNDQPVFAADVVRYYGEPVAAVAAPTLRQARELAEQVSVDLTPLPVVEDMKAALNPDAPRLFPQGNLCSEFHNEKGDIAGDFERSALIVEDTFYTPIQTHGFMEPEAAFTEYGEDGRLYLWSSTQNAFSDRTTVSSVLNIPEEQIVSRAATVGGGFGGKDGNTSQIYAALVTYFTGKPARFAFTREENIRYGMKRHPAEVYAKIGFDAEGHMLAFEGRVYMDTGAYALLGPAVLGLGTEHMTGPYYIPSVKMDGWLAYTNHTPASAMRGFGAPQTALAVETLVNEAAEKLKIDPLEIRKLNALHRGQPGPMGAVMEHSIGFEEALDQFKASAFYQEMCTCHEPDVAYGFAAGMMSSGMGKDVPDRATVRIDHTERDTYIVRVGLVDIGQGSETLLAMIAADALGVPVEKIEMRMGDTEETIGSGSTAASRTTYVCGNAILLAAEQLKKEMQQGGSTATAYFDFPELPGHDGVHAIFGFLVQGVKIRLDRLTGAVSILSAHNITEAGHIMHPQMMAGQIFGGMAMSVGYTLSEELRYRGGRTMEDSFATYIMPTAMDAPHMTNEDVPYYEESGPYGAKGVAEAATVALAPAVADALHRLLPTLHIRSLPVDRMEILNAIIREEEKQ